MKFIIGLGNPDSKYSSTKHNVGFNVVKKIAKEHGIEINKEAYSSLLGKGKISGEDVVLFLPQTYMNLSGKAVEELFRNDIRKIEDMLVICDDINLKLGRIRLRRKGSAGGHKGLGSIISALQRDDFARLRIGIATDVHKGDITNYVLTPFKRSQTKNVSHVLKLASDAAAYWVKNGIDPAMTKFNKKKLAMS